MIDHVIIMAAGPSRGMESLTRTRPKAMLPLLGMPMIARVMDDYYKAGIRRFTVVVGEQEGAAAAWLSTQWHKDIQLQFAPQGHQRGTASTLFATRGLIDGPVIIAPCDVLVPEEHVKRLAIYFETHPSDAAVLSLYYAPDDIAFGASVFLDPRGNVMYISETPTGAHQGNMTALPVYAFTPKVLEYLDRVPVKEESGERVMASAIQSMIDSGQVVGALETGWRVRLNEPEDILTACILLMARYEQPVLESAIGDNVTIIPPVHVDSGVTIGSGSKLGPNVYLETGTVIESNTAISESVILARRIGSGKSIAREVVSKDRL